MDYALEQSTHLITCAYTLSDIALTQDLKNAPTLLAAAHYLTGMAKALSQDVSPRSNEQLRCLMQKAP